MNIAALSSILLIVIFAWLSNHNTIPGYKIYRLLLLLLLSIISALNAPLADDHEVYVRAYERASSFDFLSYFNLSLLDTDSFGYEPGYAVISWIMAHLKIKEAMFFFIIALFVNDSILRFISHFKYSFVILLWVYIGGNILIMQQNLVRQFIAVAIFLYGFTSLMNNNNKKFIILVLLSSLFHYSAIINIIFLPIHILLQRKKGDKLVLCLVILSYGVSLLSLVSPQVISTIVTHMGGGYYGHYLSTESDVGMQVIMTFLILYNLLTIYIILNWENNHGILALSVVAIVLLNNIGLAVPNLLRLTYYYTIPTSAFIFHSLHPFSGTSRTVLVQYRQCIFLFFFLYYVWNVFNNFILQEGVMFSDVYSLKDFINV